MTPCPGREKFIAWLALDALDAEPARELRAHLETCSGCRHYFAKMSQLTGQIAAAAPAKELPSSESFHRRVMVRIKAEPPASVWERIIGSLQPQTFNWRVAMPAMAAVLVLLLAVGVAWRLHPTSIPQPPTAVAITVPPKPTATADLTPTIAHYQQAAGESLDKLDALLARESESTGGPAQICTASTMSLNF
jgi:anti-sigma-K factor RskA